MRRAARSDANHGAIVQALLELGCTVQSLAAVGGGVPDLLIGWRGMCLLFEVKDGGKPPSERKLTPDQVRWHRDWRGQVAVVETVDDAIQAVLRANAGLPGIPRAPLTQAAAPATSAATKRQGRVVAKPAKNASKGRLRPDSGVV